MTKPLAGAGVRTTLRRNSLLSSPFLAFTHHWSLTRELARSEIVGRYRGANFGLLWSLISPFLILGIYAVAFGEILKGRWPQQTAIDAPFSLILFIGIVIHGFFGECFSRAPRLMIDHANYVKKVVFPLEILPWSMVLSGLFHALMNLAVFVILCVIFLDKITPWLLFLPLLLIPLVLMTLAVSWVVASLGVYLRDLSQVTPVISTALFFLSSAIIPVEAVPERFQSIYRLNPLTFIIDQARAVALWGHAPDWMGLAIFTVCAFLAAYLAAIWFRKVSKGFADVL